LSRSLLHRHRLWTRKHLEWTKILTAALKTFTNHYVLGIQADIKNCGRPLISSIAQVTSLVPTVGYQSVAKLIDQGLSLDVALARVQFVAGDSCSSLRDEMNMK
jgi:aspartate ammonia-lyase